MKRLPRTCGGSSHASLRGPGRAQRLGQVDHGHRAAAAPVEARDGVEFEGRKIPGLGEPNVPESFSVWGVNVSNPAAPKVISRLKTGLLVGAPSDNGKTVGGSAPNFLAANGDKLFVSNGNNDIIERIDLTKNEIVAKQRIIPSPLVAKVRNEAVLAHEHEVARIPAREGDFINELAIESEALDLQLIAHRDDHFRRSRITQIETASMRAPMTELVVAFTEITAPGFNPCAISGIGVDVVFAIAVEDPQAAIGVMENF